MFIIRRKLDSVATMKLRLVGHPQLVLSFVLVNVTWPAAKARKFTLTIQSENFQCPS